MPLTAGMPLPKLVNTLERGAWGDLGEASVRGLRVVLGALSRALDPRSGAGKITAPQLADLTGYTERWVRRCLGLLEDLGIIDWERGGIYAGSPVPSWIRVNKAIVLDLIHIARKKQGETLQGRAHETRRRVARLRTSYTERPGRKPKDRKTSPRSKRPPHAELSTALLSPYGKEVPTPASGPVENDQPTRKEAASAAPPVAQSAIARIRADLAARHPELAGKKRQRRQR